MLPCVPKPGSKQESPISASPEAKEILQRLSKQIGIRKIDLLDHALKALDDYVGHYGGRLLLPLRFNETFRVMKLPEPGSRMILREPPSLQPEQSRGAGRRKANVRV